MRSRPAADTTALVLGIVAVVTALITAAVQGADHDLGDLAGVIGSPDKDCACAAVALFADYFRARRLLLVP